MNRSNMLGVRKFKSEEKLDSQTVFPLFFFDLKQKTSSHVQKDELEIITAKGFIVF